MKVSAAAWVMYDSRRQQLWKFGVENEHIVNIINMLSEPALEGNFHKMR